jgi:hypothetical protein
LRSPITGVGDFRALMLSVVTRTLCPPLVLVSEGAPMGGGWAQSRLVGQAAVANGILYMLLAAGALWLRSRGVRVFWPAATLVLGWFGLVLLLHFFA